MTAVYDRNEHLPEKREALEAWERHLDEFGRSAGGERKARARAGHLRLVEAA